MVEEEVDLTNLTFFTDLLDATPLRKAQQFINVPSHSRPLLRKRRGDAGWIGE